MHKIIKISNKLFNHYGPLGWWPTTRHNPYPEYLGGPINDDERFEVMIGAILTQNTTWKNVEKAILNLIKTNNLKLDKILKLSESELAELIKSSGYYNQKTKKLKNIALFVKEESFNNLKKLEPVKLREKLLTIKGVGPETADSITLYAFNKATPITDTYTKRIFTRIGFLEDGDYDTFKKFQEDNFPSEPYKLQELHAQLVELAKDYCIKNGPDCLMCPIYEYCEKNY